MKISVVIPVFNGAKTVGLLADELMRSSASRDIEIVLVNDGSRDDSHSVCVEVFRKYRPRVKYILLAKNFGEHNAVLAGLCHAKGDYAVIIDDDFQNPPDEIELLVKEAVRHKYDVVYSRYAAKQHSRFRNAGSALNNIVASYLLDKPRDLYLSSFKCINRFVIDEVTKYKGPFPYIDGLILRVTRNIGQVLVRHQKRREGRSGYTLRKLVGLWLNMLVNFSVHPLRVSTIFGFLFSIVGGLFSVYLIIDKIMHPEMPAGITSILVTVLILSGINLIILGLLGEYIGKQLLSLNQTPQYVIREVFDEDSRRRD